MKTPRHLYALLVLLTLTFGQSVSAQEPGRAIPDTKPAPGLEHYKIGPEDVLFISVWKNDALSRAVIVRPDGKISLPLLNDVQAAGLTPAELQALLVQKLSDYMPAPEVAVIVNEVHSFKVSVMGEVARPGRYELKSRATVVDVIALAGGFTPFASRSRIVILRPEGNTIKRIPFNYSKLAADGFLDRLMNSGGAESESLYLRPGDTVLVP